VPVIEDEVDENLPISQSTQSVEPSAPPTLPPPIIPPVPPFDLLPSEQSTHAEDPVIDEYLPAEQNWHVAS
jgi:hypothetical protein